MLQQTLQLHNLYQGDGTGGVGGAVAPSIFLEKGKILAVSAQIFF